MEAWVFGLLGWTEAALQDCGEGPMPAGISCYEGQLLVETFKVKVTNSDGTSGSLDMKARELVSVVDERVQRG